MHSADTALRPSLVRAGLAAFGLAALLAPAAAQHAREGTDAEAEAAEQAVQVDRLRWRTAGLLVATVGGTAAYGRAHWWQDGFGGGFKTSGEGWFGGGTANGGADKLGHLMVAYAGTRLLARGFEWAGHAPQDSLRIGVATAVGTLMGVEVVDGLSRKWRFSGEDAIADLAGGALAWWMERDPALDDLVDLRIRYSPSSGPAGRSSFNPFGDYSGQRYLLVFKASGVPGLRAQPLLRYLELSVGYGARGFEADARALNPPSRRVYLGVSLNLSEVLRRTVYGGDASPSRAQRLSETFLEYVQVPAAGAAMEHTLR